MFLDPFVALEIARHRYQDLLPSARMSETGNRRARAEIVVASTQIECLATGESMDGAHAASRSQLEVE